MSFCPCYHLAGASPLPWTWGIIFSGIQHSHVDGCSTASCNFGVLVVDEHTSFYSAIFGVSQAGYIIVI